MNECAGVRRKKRNCKEKGYKEDEVPGASLL